MNQLLKLAFAAGVIVGVAGAAVAAGAGKLVVKGARRAGDAVRARRAERQTVTAEWEDRGPHPEGEET